MPKPHTAPYGNWKSPITTDTIVTGTIGLGDFALQGDDVYWIEGRPWEAGRCVIVRRTPDGQIQDITPPPFNARTRVHEYGGGAMLVTSEELFFSNFADNGVYRAPHGKAIQRLTHDEKMRYADFCWDERRQRLLCVREDHTHSDTQCTNTLASIDLRTGANTVLVEGNDFYSSPTLSHDGRQLAWLTWNHPAMPWDGTELWLAEIHPDGSVGPARTVAGGEKESIFQPLWSPDDVLYFVSDRTGWWNLYRAVGSRIEPLLAMEAEFAAPQWVCGMSLYQFASAHTIVCAYNQRGKWGLATLDTANGIFQPLNFKNLTCADIRQVRASQRHVVFCAGSPDEMDTLLRLDLSTRETQILRPSSRAVVDKDYLSIAEPIEFPTANDLTAHAYYYAPKNKDYVAPAGELPPLIVISHGGPTSATSSTLRLSIQFWTSRGFAVVDVNYGGSTGYGRTYRERLNGNWGIVDVDDCINAARYLVSRSAADDRRMIIRGGSAGGYTTLAALTFRDFFQAGASYYGISDLEALEQDCHKFESHYNSSLIAPYPAAKAIYRERSPIHHTERLSCPIILFQGLDDRVVPPNQSEKMVEALRAKGITVAYVAFEGEGHGFRKAENIKRAFEDELRFYEQVFRL